MDKRKSISITTPKLFSGVLSREWPKECGNVRKCLSEEEDTILICVSNQGRQINNHLCNRCWRTCCPLTLVSLQLWRHFLPLLESYPGRHMLQVALCFPDSGLFSDVLEGTPGLSNPLGGTDASEGSSNLWGMGSIPELHFGRTIPRCAC